MSPRRLVVITDSAAPLAQLDREVQALKSWSPQPLVIEQIVFGRTASWLPEGVALANSAVTRSVGTSSTPALGDALRLIADRAPAAAIVVLAGEPDASWADAARALPDFRAAITFGASPPAAIGQGLLGAPFRPEHVALGLRWLLCELFDRSWGCECGALRVLGEAPSCARCGSAELPRHLELHGRTLVLAPNARVFPHHLGRPLSFDAAPVVIDETAVDGPVTIDGVRGTVRRGLPARASRKGERPLTAELDRCAACEGALTPPVLHSPPDPRRFCSACVSAPSRCDFCNTPLGARGGNVWPDGRAACRECWSTAVTDVSTLEGLARRAPAWLSQDMQLDPGPCPVHFEHAAAIGALTGRPFIPAAGHTARAIGFYARPPIGPFLCIEHGTPQAIAYGVLVHELAHAWQAQHWPAELDRVIIEGHAMWLEYQALLAAGAIHAARHTELYGDPVYGLGFRLALAVEKEKGAEFVKHRLHEVLLPLPAKRGEGQG